MSDLIDALWRQAQTQPQGQALGFWQPDPAKRQRLSLAQFWDQVQRVASAMRQQLPAGSRVLLLFEPSIEFGVAFWACLRAGMVAVPTYPPADPRTRSRFLEIAKDAQADWTLTTRQILKQSQWVRWLIGSLRRMRWQALEDLLAHESLDLPAVADSELALLQYTSGSTASPRGVMLSHANLHANVTALNQARQQAGDTPEHFVCWVPLYHDMGLISGVVMPLVLGYPSTLLSPLHFLQQPLRWLQAISEVRGTISAGPNFAYELCLRRVKPEQLAALDLSSWRVALNGAEAILPETLERFATFFAPCGFRREALYPSYGLAESTVFVCGPKPGQIPELATFDTEALQAHRAEPSAEPDARTLVSVGRCWNQGQVRIVAPDSSLPCEPGQIGEIWLSGPSIGRGYWQRADETEQSFAARIASEPETGPFLRTGDLGFVWQEALFITGRIKELIIVHGQNYYPQPIEQLIQDADPAFRPGCGAAFAVGQNPERVVVVQEVRKQVTHTAQELEALARAALYEHLGLPLSELVLLPAGQLPKTSSGKVQRGRCRELYLKGKLKRWKA